MIHYLIVYNDNLGIHSIIVFFYYQPYYVRDFPEGPAEFSLVPPLGYMIRTSVGSLGKLIFPMITDV